MTISEDTGSPTASQPHMSHEQPHTRVSWRRIFTTFSQVHPSLLSLSPALCFTEKQAEVIRTTCQQGCWSRLLAWGRLAHPWRWLWFPRVDRHTGGTQRHPAELRAQVLAVPGTLPAVGRTAAV